MPALSADDRARRRADLVPMITTTPALVTIARAPDDELPHDGVEPIASDVPMMIWPADGQSPPKELAMIPVVGGARVDAIGYAVHGVDIQYGDEVTTANARYNVVGVASWNATVAVALKAVIPS